MSWDALVNGKKVRLDQPTKGAVLRVLKSKGLISKYWFHKQKPEPTWVSTHIVELIGEDDDDQGS